MKHETRHNSTAGRLIWAILVAALVGAPQVLAAEEIGGEWELTMDFNGRQSFSTLSIAKNADGTLTGKWGSTDLSNVKFDGQKLTFVRTLKFNDQEFSMNYAGTLQDGKLTGTVSSDRGEFAVNGARRKPKAPALGQWDLSYRIGDRDVTAKLAVSQKPDGTLEGKWTSPMGESALSNVKCQGDKLSFTRKVKFNDNEFEMTFDGTAQGDKLTGTSKNESMEVAVTGQRVGAALVGKWELTTTSDRGPRTSTLIVDGDLTGRYESFGGEIPVRDLKLEGNQVSFKVTMGFGDQTRETEFKATLEGKTLKGQYITQNGTRELTGKKIEGTPSAMNRSGQAGPAPALEVAPPAPDRQPDVIYVPTPQVVVDKMLELAEVKPGDVVYDLGCGDGRIIVTAAKKFGVRAYGFDINPQRVKESLENVKANGVEDLVTIMHADVFTLDLSKANVITLYLLPSLNVKLMPQLEKCKPGTRIVSHDFDMRGAKPVVVHNLTVDGDDSDENTNYGPSHTIYKWVVPWEKE
jgi:hypothetical protein